MSTRAHTGTAAGQKPHEFQAGSDSSRHPTGCPVVDLEAVGSTAGCIGNAKVTGRG